jgi:hypothetical protein
VHQLVNKPFVVYIYIYILVFLKIGTKKAVVFILVKIKSHFSVYSEHTDFLKAEIALVNLSTKSRGTS